jgi:hypothetical protein
MKKLAYFNPKRVLTMGRTAMCSSVLLVLFLCQARAGGVLDSWQGTWSPYRVIDDAGRERRLVKATIRFPQLTTAGQSLCLLDAQERLLDTQTIPAGKQDVWAHGFWVPRGRTPSLVELRDRARVLERGAVVISADGQEPVELPLRLDRLNRDLLHRLQEREAAAAPAPAADVVSYLHQDDIVYQRPSTDWVEGLPLGNGDVGALVSGSAGKEQTFYLDKTDVWYTAPDSTALGRSYVGTVRICYRSGAGRFAQRLSLGRAEVETRDGQFHSVARVDALHNRLEVEFRAPEAEIEVERKPVTLWVDRKSSYKNAERLFGSWSRVTPPAVLQALRAEAAKAPHTQVDWGQGGDSCWFLHTAPNLRTAVMLQVSGADVVWQPSGDGFRGKLTRGGLVRLQVALATSRENPDPLSRAKQILGPSDRAAHLEWWRQFWSRSWIELPDKLEENLWYIGLYQQASCSRSDQAVSFFGLWHPLDYRTWYDDYTTDAQVEMMWWQCFGSNHLELLYPSHRTFGRFVADLVEHTPGAGMLLPHELLPEWAGGAAFFTGANHHKGSGPWYTMNFWWDYLYSGDREFLREVTYPLLRMTADYLSSALVKEADGRYHCLNSQSPEQENTPRDNIYDWAMLISFYRAVIRASEVLDVDSSLRAEWRERLDHLFPPPTDGKTLWEAPNNPHPYRCHPVVMFPLYPTNAISYGSPLFESARRTVPVVTRLLGFRYEDRHAAIPDFQGGIEPNGFSSGILTTNAARLGDRNLYERLLYGLIVRFHLKQNGLRALVDTRQSDEISRASLVEAANAHTTAITESLLQSWDDHVRMFPCIGAKGRVRFAGLRSFGGFVISAEAVDGRLRWAQVKSLVDGTLRLALPPHDKVIVRSGSFRWMKSEAGEERLELACRAGSTYEILTGESIKPDLTLARTEPRQQPRAISIAEVERRGGLLQYPEDLPFGQVVEDENLYLGRPVKPGPPRPAPELGALLARAQGSEWQQRQEAARLFVRVKPSPEVLAALDTLCADPVNVVAHTAAVTLVHLGTPQALAIAQKHAERDRVSGLRREVEKARRRMAFQRAAM